MEEISLKGENYVKASILARKFGYTSDYVGQLCRSDQVTATLIGRTWYVTEESLLRHKKGRYRSSLAKSKEMVRRYAEEYNRSPRTTNVKRIVRYEEDEGDLFPTLKGREESISREEIVSEPEESTVESNDETESRIAIQYQSSEPPVPSRKPYVPRRMPQSRQRPRPPVRTIPAYAMSEIAVKRAPQPLPSVENQLKSKPSPRTRKRSLVPALIFMFLLGEMLLMTAVIGMEKRLTVKADGSGMIVYDFEPELVATSIKSLMDKR